MPWHTVSPASRLREGQLRCFEIAGRRLAVGRTARGSFALDDACPHAGGRLSEGRLDGGAVICPIHGYPHDLATGEGLDDGAEVRVHPCELDGDVLRIRIEEEER
jgi:3-phenylpropionate/trans-cinnamate dioxygenase ferredoxin subunit